MHYHRNSVYHFGHYMRQRMKQRGSKSYKPNGAREIARRLRQLATGFLTQASRGLTDMAHAILVQPIPAEGRFLTSFELQQLRNRGIMQTKRVTLVKPIDSAGGRGYLHEKTRRTRYTPKDAPDVWNPTKILVSLVSSL